MKSPKLLRLKKEAEPERLRLEAQIRKTKELLEQLRRDLDRHLEPVRKMKESERYLVLEFNQRTSFNVYGIRDDGYIPWRSPNITLQPYAYYNWTLDELGETSEVKKTDVYVTHYGAPEKEAILKAKDIMINSGYRFIPCTWLDDHHVQIHWPEDLK